MVLDVECPPSCCHVVATYGGFAIPVTEGIWRHPAAEGSAHIGGKRYVVDWICSSEQGDGLLCSVYRFSLAEIFVHMGQLC